jgi:hypothetical protein
MVCLFVPSSQLELGDHLNTVSFHSSSSSEEEEELRRRIKNKKKHHMHSQQKQHCTASSTALTLSSGSLRVCLPFPLN